AIECHALSALLCDQRRAPIVHADDGFERLPELAPVEIPIRAADVPPRLPVQHAVLVDCVVQPLLDGDAALVLELHLDEAQLRIDILADAHLAAPAPAA